MQKNIFLINNITFFVLCIPYISNSINSDLEFLKYQLKHIINIQFMWPIFIAHPLYIRIIQKKNMNIDISYWPFVDPFLAGFMVKLPPNSILFISKNFIFSTLYSGFYTLVFNPFEVQKLKGLYKIIIESLHFKTKVVI